MKNEFLHEPFVDALKDLYDAEQQLVKALPKVEKVREKFKDLVKK